MRNDGLWFDREYLKGLCKKKNTTFTELASMLNMSRGYFSSGGKIPEGTLRTACEILDGDWDSLVGTHFSDEYKGVKAQVPEPVDAVELQKQYDDAAEYSLAHMVKERIPEPKIFDINKAELKEEQTLMSCLEDFRREIVKAYIEDSEITPLDVMILLEKTTKNRMKEIQRCAI